MTRKWVLLTLALFFTAGIGLAKNLGGNLDPASSATGAKGWRSRLRTKPVAVKKSAVPVKKLDPKAWHLQEDFEGTFPPAGWTTQDLAGMDESWQQSDLDYYNGSYSAFIDYDCSEYSEDWLITPQITIQANDTLYFWMNVYDPGYEDDTYIKISTGDNQPASFTTTLLHLYDDYGAGNYVYSWTQYAVDLSAYAGQTVYLAFHHTDDCGDGIFIDDVSVGHEYIPTGHDVCVNSIDLPTAVITPTVPFTPTATIQDLGMSPESDFQIFFRINDSLGAQLYLDSALIASPDSILPDSLRQFIFSGFTPAAYTRYTAVVWTTLADDYNWNDTLAKQFRTWDLDVAANAILNPLGSANPDLDIIPRVVFHNAATQTADFTANFEATYGGNLMYDQEVNISGLAGGADTTVEFPAWPGVRLEGIYQMTAYAEMDHDMNNANDTISGSFGSGYNIWVSKTPLPTYQYGQAVAPWNGRIYLFGGAPGGTFCNTIQYYDTLTETWNNSAITFPTNLFGASAITLGDRIFVIGGCETWANPLTSVYCYWPDGDSLTTRASLPTATMEAAAGLWRDSLIYVMGGGNWTMPQINNVQIYDVANDSWNSGTAIPGTVGTNGGGVCGDTIVSVGGYLTSACYYGVIDTTDPTSITWTAGTPYPAGNLCRPSTAVRDHKLYVAAGYNGSSATATAYYYSPAEDTWTQLPDKTSATIGAGQAAIMGEWLYVIAGESTGENEALFLGTSDKANPVVTAVDPANNGTGVHLLAPITVNFSKPMDTTTVTYSCNPDPAGWSRAWSADLATMTLNHSAFAYSTVCSVSVDSGKSLDGYDLKAGTAPNPFTFTTWEAPEVIANQLNTMENYGASQIFYDYPSFSCYVADDIDIPAGYDSVKITAVEIEGTYWNSHTGHVLDSLYLAFTGDSSASHFPAFSQALWTENMNPAVFDEDTTGSSEIQFIVYLDNPVVLTPGKSWMTCAPYMAFSAKKDGQYGMNLQSAITGTEASWLNPGGGFGAGTDWLRASVIAGSSMDAIFRVLGHTYLAAGAAGQPSEAGLPRVYSLASSYPNPSRDNSTIKFALPQAGQVKIEVYNIAGQRVKTLVNGNMGAGYHQVTWNGRNEAGQKVANGVYMYRMNSGSFQSTKKLLMVK
ncbi:choice-of-anchor J domain-containing protein [candidate division TA06 bacterium]|nr:choice-of-anchor J domain-containing protein [candidate division TA06 bacterium]